MLVLAESKPIHLFTLMAALLAVSGCSNSPDDAPLDELEGCQQPVFFQPEHPADTVAVVGTFTDWGYRAIPMEDLDGDGLYVAVINPGPGEHQYRIYVDGQTFLDPYNPLTMFGENGVENSYLDLTHCAEPALLSASTEDEVAFTFRRSPSGRPLDPTSVTATTNAGVALPVSIEDERIVVNVTGLELGKHRIRVAASDTAGQPAEPVSFAHWVDPSPFQWEDAVIYQVFIDRFRSGDGVMDTDASIASFHGGDLQGALAALREGYFEDLGVNVLWLSPVYDNPEGHVLGRNGFESEAYHGYWPIDPHGVEERFGGETALRALIQESHERGIRVILDVVMNQVHQDHPYWTGHRADGWFNNPDGSCICGTTCPWGQYIQECWFDPFLPDLRWRNPDVVKRVVDDAIWWIDTYDVDGFRMDAVPMMPRLALRHLRARIDEGYQAGGEHFYLVGETYSFRGDQSLLRWYLGPHTLTGQFDFPVMWALRDSLAGRISFDQLDREVLAGERAWEGADAVMAPFLGNHDVPRFITDVNGDPMWSPKTNPARDPVSDRPFELLEMAWTFILSQPGAPVIYYGDEIGMIGANDPDNRRDMRFGDQLTAREGSVLRHVSRLGRARQCSKALRRGTRVTLDVDLDYYVWGRDAGDGYPAIGAMNRRPEPINVTVSLPSTWELAPGFHWVDVVSGETVSPMAGTVTLTIPATGSALLVQADCAP